MEASSTLYDLSDGKAQLSRTLEVYDGSLSRRLALTDSLNSLASSSTASPYSIVDCRRPEYPLFLLSPVSANPPGLCCRLRIGLVLFVRDGLPCCGGGGARLSFRGANGGGLEFDIKPSRECWLLQEYGEASTFLFLSILRGEGWFRRFEEYDREAGPAGEISCSDIS